MKNLMNKIMFLFMITVFSLLLLNSCSVETTQVSQNSSTEKTSGKMDSAQENAIPRNSKGNKPAICQSVTEQELMDQIPKLPNTLSKQFDDGNVSMSYDDHKLIFKGYIHGNGNNFRALLNGFDKFRSQECVRTVLFEGSTDSVNFEWRPDPRFISPTPPSDCKTEIEEEFAKSLLKDQINKNLFYHYDEQTKILKFNGYIHELPNKGKFNSLIGQLQRLMTNGCIKKVEFNGEIVKGYKAMRLRSFEWTVCGSGECECGGMCVACPC
ncbi:MAG: hypothetical protein ACR2MD_10430 [Aridibacter sp.]